MGPHGSYQGVFIKIMRVEPKILILRFLLAHQRARTQSELAENILEFNRRRWMAEVVDNVRLYCACFEKGQRCPRLRASWIVQDGNVVQSQAPVKRRGDCDANADGWQGGTGLPISVGWIARPRSDGAQLSEHDVLFGRGAIEKTRYGDSTVRSADFVAEGVSQTVFDAVEAVAKNICFCLAMALHGEQGVREVAQAYELRVS